MTYKVIKLSLKDKITLNVHNDKDNFIASFGTSGIINLPEAFIKYIPTDFINIEYVENIKKAEPVSEEEECDCEFKPSNWIPGNIHSEQSMICDMCGKECHQAGSVYDGT